jgi:dephospho-CoA kinase
MILGVAGKYCAGKDLIVRYLQELGYREINVDKLGHWALELKKDELTAAFGDTILATDNTVDRQALGRIVFDNPQARKRLEALVHPLMIQKVKKEIYTAREHPAHTVRLVINAALLFPMGLAPLCDAVIWVRAPFPWRLQRALTRDHLSLKNALKRLLSQSTNELKPGVKDVDMYYVDNWCTKEGVRRRVKQLVARLEKY